MKPFKRDGFWRDGCCHQRWWRFYQTSCRRHLNDNNSTGYLRPYLKYVNNFSLESASYNMVCRVINRVALFHEVLHTTGKNALTGVTTVNGLWKMFIIFRHRKTDTCAKRKKRALKTNFIVTVRAVVNGHLQTEIFNCPSHQQHNIVALSTVLDH